MSSKEKHFSFIDLFAGIGGFRVALEELGGKCVFTSEFDKEAQKTYLANFGEMPSGDITKIDETEIPSHDILCAGFPCQPFSISGKQNGFNDKRGVLFYEILRIATYKKTKVLFLENVRNFEKHDNGKTLLTVVNSLKEIGYEVRFKVLNASYYGVPTSRERIYIIAIKKDLNYEKFEFPKPLNKKISLKDMLEVSVEDKYYIDRSDIRLNQNTSQKPLINFSSLAPIRVGTIGNGGQGERIYCPNGHAITFSAYGGGVAAKTGAYLINGKVRKLTPKECAKVMGFPNDFKIVVSDSQAYKQFGNSVAVPVVSEIGKAILNIL